MSYLSPAGQMILCEKLLTSVSKGGIIIPDTAKDTETTKTYRMKVIEIGPGIAHSPGSPPVRRRFADESYRIERLTCQEIVGIDFVIGSVLICSRFNYNCDLEEAGQRREMRMVRAEDVLAVERAD